MCNSDKRFRSCVSSAVITMPRVTKKREELSLCLITGAAKHLLGRHLGPFEYVSFKRSSQILYARAHTLNNIGETEEAALEAALATWTLRDGQPFIDYSDQDIHSSRPKHAPTIDTTAFTKFIQRHTKHDFNIMLEIKDKEQSASLALNILRQLEDPRTLHLDNV